MISPIRKLCAVLLLGAACALAQAPADNTPPPQTNDSDRNAADIPAQTPKVAVEQPPSALKTLLINTAKDQKVIFTSPFHMNRHNAKYWIGFTVVTAGLIASDRTTSKWLPDNQEMRDASNAFTQIGEVYVLYPVAGMTYLFGVLGDKPKLKETGALEAEALTDTLILSSVIKAITGRERPNLPGGNGNWFKFGNYSFVSGHAIMSWGFASVIAHEYHSNKAVPIIAYTLATAISFARFTGQDHFLSDVFAGGAMGYFIGTYVYRKHADPAIHHAPISRLRPDSIGPYVNPKTGGVGLSLNWVVGSD
jgi:membrane-associated phospholipid phosphatase